MRLKLTTAPAIEPVTLEEAKSHLRVDTDDDNALISTLITTAREMVEKETERALITQIWQMYLDEAPRIIEIPKPPLQMIDSIFIVDENGAEKEVDKESYIVDASGNLPGRVKLKDGYSWPSHPGFASFVVEFTAGYGDEAIDVPATIRQAILQLVGFLYENRGSEEIPPGVKAMLRSYKIIRL